jgi:hypothetical protein
MRTPTLLLSLAFVTIPSLLGAQDGVIQKGTAKGGIKGTSGRAEVKAIASNSGSSAAVLEIVFVTLAGGQRVTPSTKPELRLQAQTPSSSFSWGASQGGGWAISDIERAETAIVSLSLGREGSIECLARVPASYQASSSTLEIRMGDIKRFFDASGRPVASLCGG